MEMSVPAVNQIFEAYHPHMFIAQDIEAQIGGVAAWREMVRRRQRMGGRMVL